MDSELDRLIEDVLAPATGEVLDAARLRLLDALVSGAIGATTDVGSRSVPDSLLGLWPGSQSRVGNEEEILSGTGALARLIRCTETDDIDLTSCVTTAAIAVPAALGGALVARGRDVGEYGAERLLAAVAAGYEAAIRLGEAIEGPFALYRGTWPTLAAAPVASAAAAGVALGQSEGELAASLARAARIAIPARPAGDARWTAFGDAVRAGVAAAAFHSGGDAPLERAPETPSAYEVLAGQEAAPASPGGARVCGSRMKLWCSAAQLGAAIDATCVLADEHDLASSDVERITVFVPSYYAAMIDRREVTDRVSSLLSAQYQLAVAISHRDDLYDCARTHRRDDAAFLQLMARVGVEVDDALGAEYPREWPARVRIDARGSSFEMTSSHRSPDPEWSIEKVESKAERLFAAARFESPEWLCASVRGLEDLGKLLEDCAAQARQRVAVQ